ncbi:MAG TPA: SsrA-binding protein SmpB [Capsulimonadaceae bacterium]|jgi:SsrA-binding protein
MAVKKEKDARKPASLLNRRAYHEYEISETIEAGIVLTGTEVKSLRLGRANIAEAYCRIQHGEVWIYNMHISPYEQGNIYNVEPIRTRKLLLHNYEIIKITSRIQEKGLTLVPTKVYFSKGRAKVEIGVAKGRQLYDKRENIANKDREREARRQFAERE